MSSFRDLARVSVPSTEQEAVERLPGLSLAERCQYETFRVPKRRHEWLAGRLAARELIAARHRVSPHEIEIGVIRIGAEAGRPIFSVRNRPSPLGLSIAHTGSSAIAALASSERERVGVDLEPVGDRGEAFENVAFADSELDSIYARPAEERPLRTTAAFVLKEAFLKAIGTGLRVSLRRLRIRAEALDALLGGEVAARGRDLFELEDAHSRWEAARMRARLVRFEPDYVAVRLGFRTEVTS